MSLSPGFATTEFDKMTDNTFYTPDHYDWDRRDSLLEGYPI